MSDNWDEFSDADVHIVDVIRSVKSGRCVDYDPTLFSEYGDEVRDFAHFVYCVD